MGMRYFFLVYRIAFAAIVCFSSAASQTIARQASKPIAELLVAFNPVRSGSVWRRSDENRSRLRSISLMATTERDRTKVALAQRSSSRHAGSRVATKNSWKGSALQGQKDHYTHQVQGSMKRQPLSSRDEQQGELTSAEDTGRLEGTLLMVLVAILWGSNFPAVKATLDAGLPGSVAGALRFSVAALALLPLLKSDKPLPREFVIGGFECGACLALGYIAQSLALHDLPAGAVAFIASLQVVLVPVIETVFFNSPFTSRLALAAGLCVGGVGLLEMGGMTPSADVSGENLGLMATALALLQPVGFGASYIRIEQLMKKFPENGLQLSSLQLISNAAIALSWCALDKFVLSGQSGAAFDLSALGQLAVVGGILYTGLISTALTVLLQTRALGKIPAADSSVIVATEPVWAAAFAAVLLGEVLDKNELIGGGMILLGCLANTLLPENFGSQAEHAEHDDDHFPERKRRERGRTQASPLNRH